MVQNRKILIIDDYLPIREEVVGFLSMEGYTVLSAKDGAEGIQMAIQHKPDLIICDIEMPQMDGYEVYKSLEQIPLTSSIPFIFLTAKTQPADFREGLRLGADDYLIKPLKIDELLMTINKRLEKTEKLKQTNEDKFNVLLDSPLVGICLYQDEKFILTNNKLTEITGYSRNELNKTELSNIILGDTNNILNELCLCLKGVHDSARIKISVLSKEKKAIILDSFCKAITLENKYALIVSVIESTQVKKEQHLINADADSSEMSKIIEYLLSLKKDDVVEQIINIRELLNFDNEEKTNKVLNKIKLSERESQVLQLICMGYTNNEIADKLFISNRTVDNHRANMLSKTNTKNTAALVAFAINNRLVSI